jgi:hypothetical protein
MDPTLGLQGSQTEDVLRLLRETSSETVNPGPIQAARREGAVDSRFDQPSRLKDFQEFQGTEIGNVQVEMEGTAPGNRIEMSNQKSLFITNDKLDAVQDPTSLTETLRSCRKSRAVDLPTMGNGFEDPTTIGGTDRSILRGNHRFHISQTTLKILLGHLLRIELELETKPTTNHKLRHRILLFTTS